VGKNVGKWAKTWASGQKRGQIKSRFRATLLYTLKMVLEIAFVEVAPEYHSDFEKAVKRAVSEVLSTAPGFIDFEMHKGIEQSNTYTFHIHWETLEHHTVGFREGDLFRKWRAIIGEYFAKPPMVEHWNIVSGL